MQHSFSALVIFGDTKHTNLLSSSHTASYGAAYPLCPHSISQRINSTICDISVKHRASLRPTVKIIVPLIHKCHQQKALRTKILCLSLLCTLQLQMHHTSLTLIELQESSVLAQCDTKKQLQYLHTLQCCSKHWTIVKWPGWLELCCLLVS